jgi:hypothetical protein
MESEQIYDSLSDWISHEMAHKSAFQPNVAAHQLHSNQTTATSDQVHGIARECPICLKSFNLENSFYHHVAAHLVRIATFALPRSTAADQDLDQRDNASHEADAAPASQDSRGGDLDGSSLSSFGTLSDTARSGADDADPEDRKYRIESC